MDPSDVTQIIRRRQTRFQSSRSGSREQMDEASRLMAEEYDSLLAEIEAFQKSGAETAHARETGPDSANQGAEAQILGDQGQLGG